ncbi:MAG: hypothetical protein MR434_07030, partial [Ruminococcus sp.]|nr:hypothetical protein [Ruminococcus sp.]
GRLFVNLVMTGKHGLRIGILFINTDVPPRGYQFFYGLSMKRPARPRINRKSVFQGGICPISKIL